MMINKYSCIIWLWFSALAKASEKCDTIEFKGESRNTSFHTNFTEQSFDFNGRPLYYSLNLEIIWWNSEENTWLGFTYFEEVERFVPLFQIVKDYSQLGFSRKENWTVLWDKESTIIKSRCLEYETNCFGEYNGSIVIEHNEINHGTFNVTAKG